MTIKHVANNIETLSDLKSLSHWFNNTPHDMGESEYLLLLDVVNNIVSDKIEQAIQAEQERIAIMADNLAKELDCVPCGVLAKAIRGDK